MRFKRPQIIVAVILLLVGAYYCFWIFRSGDVFRSSARNAPNRAALLQIRDGVQLGATHTEVLEAYWKCRTDELQLRADWSTNWIVRMPMEFGASDWVLRIEFRDGKVTAVRARTSDGLTPKDGPTDKEKAGD